MSCYDDCLKLQDDLSCVYQWSLKWQLKLNLKSVKLLTSVISVPLLTLITVVDLVQFCGPRKLSILVLLYKLQA